MSGLPVLLGLFVVAYIGSILVSNRTIRGFGLPSGVEYLVFGVAIGPHALGILPRSAVRVFEPIFVGAAAWLGLVAGLSYLVVGRRRVALGRAIAGVIGTALVGAIVAGAVWLAAPECGLAGGYPRLELALGAGCVICETTRHAVRWVTERHGARGPVSDWLTDMARASALVPLLGVGVLFALAPQAPLVAFGVPARLGVQLGVGVVMGIVAAILLGREFRRDESWGILLGASLLTAGVATRVGLSAMATLFVMGFSLGLVSRHRLDIKLMVQPTEKPVLLPVILVAGASIDFDAVPKLWLLVAVALGARLIAELVRGKLLTGLLSAARPAGARIGLGMTSTGAISLALAFTLLVCVPGAASSAVLVLAAAAALLGELVGPAMLRRSLEQVGETHEDEENEPVPFSLAHAAPGRNSDFPEQEAGSDFTRQP